jgi:hypothetical protein
MTKVILDQATLSKLDQIKDRVEVCDETGRTRGYFLPVAPRSLSEGVEVPFSEEELQQAEDDPESFSTAEVLAYLESLGNQ